MASHSSVRDAAAPDFRRRARRHTPLQALSYLDGGRRCWRRHRERVFLRCCGYASECAAFAARGRGISPSVTRLYVPSDATRRNFAFTSASSTAVQTACSRPVRCTIRAEAPTRVDRQRSPDNPKVFDQRAIRIAVCQPDAHEEFVWPWFLPSSCASRAERERRSSIQPRFRSYSA